MQTHIHHLGLENFRVFKQRTDFDFAPITILTGTNSSGKSSLINAMEILRNGIGTLDVKPPERKLEIMNKPEKPVKYGLGIRFIDKPLNTSFATEKYGDISTLLTNETGSHFSFFRTIKGYCTSENFTIEYKYKLDDREISQLNLVEILMTNEVGDEVLSINEFVKIKVSYFFDLFCRSFDASQKAWEEFFCFDGELSKNSELTQEKVAEKLRTKASEIGLYIDVYDNLGLGDIVKEYIGDRTSSLFDYTEIYKKYLKDRKISEFHDLEALQNMIENSAPVKLFINELLGITKLTDYTKVYFELLDGIEYELAENLGVDKTVPLGKLPYSAISYSANGQFELTLKKTYLFDLLGCYGISLRSDSQGQAKRRDARKALEDALSGAAANIELPITDMEEWFFTDFLAKNLSAVHEALTSFSDIDFSVVATGSQKRLRSLNDEDWLSDFVTTFFKSDEDWQNAAKTFINTWLDKFEIGQEIKIERVEKSVGYQVHIELRNGKKRNLSELGYGVQMILRILISTLMDWFKTGKFEKGEGFDWPGKPVIRIIEEPEAHLHPALQSKLADLLVASSRELGIQFIIETHSEYLIRKLQNLTAKKDIKPEDTVIYYFYPPEHPDVVSGREPQVKKINILPDGRLSAPFGEGFYDESARLMISLMEVSNPN